MEHLCDGKGTRAVMEWVPGDPDTGMAGFWECEDYAACDCEICKENAARAGTQAA